VSQHFLLSPEPPLLNKPQGNFNTGCSLVLSDLEILLQEPSTSLSKIPRIPPTDISDSSVPWLSEHSLSKIFAELHNKKLPKSDACIFVRIFLRVLFSALRQFFSGSVIQPSHPKNYLSKEFINLILTHSISIFSRFLKRTF